MNNISRRKFLFSTFVAAASPYVIWGRQSDNGISESISFKPLQVRLPENVSPVVGAWFPQEPEMHPEGFRRYLDAVEKHSHFNLLTTSMRNGSRQITDKEVHEWFKNAAVYAKGKGIGLVLEVDPRHSIAAFRSKYPDEMQERLWLKEFDLVDNQDIIATIRYDYHNGDAICSGAVTSIQMERVYCYQRGSDSIQSGTVNDITSSCKQVKSSEREISVNVSPGKEGKVDGNKICVICRVKFDYPAVFSPETIDFEADIIRQYADLPLAGLMKDEWGFPACSDGNIEKNGYWYCKHLSRAYSKSTGGRDLIRDSLLMFLGEDGRDKERQSAINHIMELYRLRNTEIEQAFYRNTKKTFGAHAFVGTHDTTFPVPDAREFERNGLNWWTATRDYAQSDETTPYCCRTSMMKKFGGPVWYNQWYAPDRGSYEKLIWSYALAGGRMNFHVLFPRGGTYTDSGIALLQGKLMQADCRVRLLNFISDAPVDCPVAVLFGHSCAMNWAGSKYDDVGMELADLFWQHGYYADLIPSTEIKGHNLHIDDAGYVRYGKQQYTAVILYHPEFEDATTVDFFREAGKGKSYLCRIGDWTRTFNADPFKGNDKLPKRMQAFSDIFSCTQLVLAELRRAGVKQQTQATITLPKWNNMGRTSAALPSSGISYLTDGTVILVSGEKDVMGDSIQRTIEVNGHDVTFDAIGVASVRLTREGKTIAMAAGGLKAFKTGDMVIELTQRVDIALWKDLNGNWQGVLQHLEGPIPEVLTTISKNWIRLSIPETLVV